MSRKMHPRLTQEQVRDIALYLKAHKWSGAKKIIAKKHGIGPSVASNIYLSKTYRYWTLGLSLQ